MTEGTHGSGSPHRLGALVGVPLLASLVCLVLGWFETGLDGAGRRTVGALVLMGGWWLGEPIPIAATSLLPVALFPVLGIASLEKAAQPYGNGLIFLFMAGFMIANAMQRWGLHRRVALRVVLAVGTSPERLVAGFMVATGFLSLWISNTAATILMLPTAGSVLELVARREGSEAGPEDRDLGIALMLGIAHAASIGGMGTLIGTAPNAMLAAFTGNELGIVLGFAEWMRIGLPVVLVLLPVTWWVLVRWLHPPGPGRAELGRDEILRELRELGPMSCAERRVLMVASLVALGWIGRLGLDQTVRTWFGTSIGDTDLAMLGVMVLFMLPSGEPGGGRVLDWETAERLPWGVLLLFGGGLSLAAALRANGVPDAVGRAVAGFEGAPPLVLVGLVSAVVLVLTEFTSNTATTAVLLPLLAGAAKGLGVHPLLLLVPAVLTASCAFMMPVGTPPNAVVIASGRVSVGEMFRAGIWINLAALVVVTSCLWCFGNWALGFDLWMARLAAGP